MGLFILFIYFSRGLSGGNHSLLHVYFSDTVSARYRRRLFQSMSDILAMFGGLTGLFIGLSFVSIYEFGQNFFILIYKYFNRFHLSKNFFAGYIFLVKPYFNNLAEKRMRRQQGIF